MCLVGEVGSASMCVCVGVYVCLKGVHTGAWCSQDARRMVSLSPEGPNKGFRHRAPTMRSGLGHKGHKNTLLITQCRSEGV